MIVVSFDEKLQRGCNYCANSSKTKGYINKETGGYVKVNTICPYDKCPYTELDGYSSYSEYLRKNSMTLRFVFE